MMKEIILKKKKNAAGQYILEFQDFPETPDSDCVLCSIIDEENKKRSYPVYRQAARMYGIWDDYLEHHGCALCSLATMLSAVRDQVIDPAQVITSMEKEILGEDPWKKNYEKPMEKQMPVSLYGISKILEHYDIKNRYVSDFQMKRAVREMTEHLYNGKPVIIETRKIKMAGKIPVQINKKYAGSYHTMILLGFDAAGNVIFTDSAHRDWAGRYQRIKSATIKDVAAYMFGKTNPREFSPYFRERKYSGGYILVDFS